MNKLTPFAQAVIFTIGAAGLTALTYAVSLYFGWIVDISIVEAIGVWLNYACVICASRQNIWNWPLGIVAVLFLGVLFWQLSLYASLTLTIGYFLPIQIWGWYLWYKGIRPDVPLPVSNTTIPQWGFALLGAALAYPTVVFVNIWFGGTLPAADCAILILSMIAQWMMNFKKVESWYLWIAVNIISFIVYLKAGAFLLGLQYAIFLLNAGYGLYLWQSENIRRKNNNLVFGRKEL